MSQSLATPTAEASARGLFARLWRDPDTRSTSIGLVAVLLFHVLLWLLGPVLLRFDHIPVSPVASSTARDFNIELTPEQFVQPKQDQKAPPKFVETNPEAPENTPDNTSNFAAQNQQAAQEKPDPNGKNDRAATQGKKDFESNQIVSGRLSQPIEHVEAVPPAPPETAAVAENAQTAPKREQNPLSGEEKFEGESKDAFGGNIAKRLENAQAIPERIEGSRDAPIFDGPQFGQPAIDPKRPRPRPQIAKTVQARPAILAEKLGTSNVGIAGIDAKWSDYGTYLQKMIDAVQFEWERLLLQQFANPAVGSSVTVKFVMNNEGNVVEIGVEQSTANETATRACLSAITGRMPYGAWSDDMRAVLGDRQEMTFTFHYQ